jgi:hypothetical protein
MVKNIETYRKKKLELSKIVERWWTQEDLFIDFQEMIEELKVLADQCPDSFSEQFRLEILEIETALRDDCLID